MLGWFGFAVAAMVFYAAQNFLLKATVEKKCNPASIMAVFMATAAVIAVTAALITGDTLVNDWNLFVVFAVINGSLFLAGSIARLESLKYIPLVMVYPIKKMDVALASLVGIAFFGETLTAAQALGVVLAIAVVWLLARDKKADKPKDFTKGVALILLAVLLFTGTDVVLKPAATAGSVYVFVALSYGLMLLPSLLLRKRVGKGRNASLETTAKWGIAIGVINFFAITSLLSALKTGALSTVFPITALAVPLAGALGVIFYKEQLTPNRIIAVLLAVAVLVLMSM
ncbi:GRP family sugar transporter [archaeon]